MPCSFTRVFLAYSLTGVLIALQFHIFLLPCCFIWVFNVLQFHGGVLGLKFHRGVNCPAVS